MESLEKSINDQISAGSVKMTDSDFNQLSRFVRDNWGIKLESNKKLMLEGRLRKRLQQLQMRTFKDYCAYLSSPEGLENEPAQMIDLVSTNKTDFFRESDHFVYLTEKALPKLESNGMVGPNKPFKIWSAGCSSGEEPYTMAMTLSEYAQKQRGFRFSILASDISTRVLQIAVTAIYPESRIEPVPLELRRKYMMRSKNPHNPQVRFVPEIRNLIRFERINFMELDTHSSERFHVIFCRNVIIYFDRETQERLLNKFAERLEKGGYLFLGHSEALTGMQVPLQAVAPMVYQKS